MALMGARRRTRGYQRRALIFVLLTALASGAVTAALVAPGAVGLPNPTASTRATVHHGGATPARHPVRSTVPSVPVALPATSTGPGTSPPATTTAFFADPVTESQVATDLIAAIDARSDAHYSIRPTPDNLSLLETWMDNEGGLWADNPLNTSLDAARYPHQVTTAGQNTGIPVFPTIKIGIDATATTLLSNHDYVGILWVLSEGSASCPTFARAVMATPWAASHYGGNPAHFCGSTGGSGTPGGATTACLRLRPAGGRSRSARMPGACGHRAPSAQGGAKSHGQKAQVTPAGSRHRGGSGAGPASRRGHAAGHAGTASRRH
jgi:hypothetical protein